MNEMKRYVNTVERCLRLDPATRLRVMNDLASDLQSRLEAGETMEQIRAELGGPEQLAAALEAEFAAHRDPAPRWRWWLLVGAAAVLAAARLRQLCAAAGGRVGRHHRRGGRPHCHLCQRPGRFPRLVAAWPCLGRAACGGVFAAGLVPPWPPAPLLAARRAVRRRAGGRRRAGRVGAAACPGAGPQPADRAGRFAAQRRLAGRRPACPRRARGAEKIRNALFAKGASACRESTRLTTANSKNVAAVIFKISGAVGF